MLFSPRLDQQRPQPIRESESGSLGSGSFQNHLYDRSIQIGMLEGFPACDHLGRSKLCDKGSKSSEIARASRIVIPRAYISVLFDGNFLRARLIYPYLSGSRISGAIQRIVPATLSTLGPSTELASSLIATRPKSAKQARH